ncbi:MAG: threonine synthase [Deltaproteobacteria bacterium CG_4_10_14_0_2_um_filter_43_8]|nr:MAG: threonine synthase [Deltaproteobacteria bacterium CG11_big_fil_rev_8_21_14_0_20_42_23]PJA21062.1 MAG: threonine synthase [Deltaproteobacteria bacterium CG_4_10_14_0_2_um_filter_43_8]PJC64244.1 MAG: threonine synthase [Deltaproteobacteria bacterium CG_4_9_14_0_2_um_filter_42_21]
MEHIFYTSSRSKQKVTFSEAIFSGQASDGGLFFPIALPKLQQKDLGDLKKLTFAELSFFLTTAWLGAEFGEEVCNDISSAAHNFPLPFSEIRKNRFVLELFHGPTQSFKDVGARFLAQCMKHVLKKRSEELTILTATSGDTGSAVADAFAGMSEVRTFILFPDGQISDVQRQQICMKREGVTPIALQGNFDDCQRLVKQAMADKTLKHLNLSSANSINVGRLVPQTFYYVYLAVQLAKEKEEVLCCVPSGNFGNVTAGLMAKHMGFPLRFIAATNANDVIPRYFQTGTFSAMPSVATYSNAMDVGNPSNLERIQFMYEQNVQKMRDDLFATVTSDARTLEVMNEVYTQDHYLLDPHGAVAWDGVDQYFNAHAANQQTSVSLATAHPAKFERAVKDALGFSPELPLVMQEQMKQLSGAIELEHSYEAFKHLLRS